MWCALCQGAVISIKDSGWDGADRHVTPEDLDKVMGTFPEGGKECGNSVDGSGGYMGVLFGNDNDWDMSSCRPEYTVNC
jgi:hypothetical protein